MLEVEPTGERGRWTTAVTETSSVISFHRQWGDTLLD